VGEIENRATIERLIKKLARRHNRLQVWFEAGPTGYGLYRQMQARGMTAWWWRQR
jgi:transposase